ncbi:uncharacterized protein LOC135941828 [Cloeon dipterum]|uniref:uncharacterized protein LOC135941828 n=1 Tax=Cloeon dipterum TaxID=197152 RepID=UPI00321F8822
MTFYWKPPRGLMELDDLMDCVQQRMLLITSVIDDRPPVGIKVQYFNEGTAIDRASHYLLRLVTSSSALLKNFVVKGECELFKKRLKLCDHLEVSELLATSLRHVDEILDFRSLDNSSRQYLLQCKDIFQKLSGKKRGLDPLQHTFAVNHPSDCSEHKIIVPFKSCLPLISQRLVKLTGGYAWVNCSQWAGLLSCVFHMHLLHGYEDLGKAGCGLARQDSRLRHLSSLIEAKYMQRPITFIGSSSQEIGEHLTCDNLEERKKLFPPCASALLKQLKQHHRLPHHARVQLTLFLKEVGMPVKEAIDFWRREYSTPASKCGANCSHSWQKDERRYVYSIRHLYGLEGARTNYAAPACLNLQGSLLAPGSAGGCPFVRMAEKPLLELLDQYQLHEHMKSSLLSCGDRPSKACNFLLKCVIDSKEDIMSVVKPSHFFYRCKNWAEEF